MNKFQRILATMLATSIFGALQAGAGWLIATHPAVAKIFCGFLNPMVGQFVAAALAWILLAIAAAMVHHLHLESILVSAFAAGSANRGSDVPPLSPGGTDAPNPKSGRASIFFLILLVAGTLACGTMILLTSGCSSSAWQKVEDGATAVGAFFDLTETAAQITADVTPPGTKVNAAAESVAVCASVGSDVSDIVVDVASNRSEKASQ